MRRRGQPAAASVRWREARSLAGPGGGDGDGGVRLRAPKLCLRVCCHIPTCSQGTGRTGGRVAVDGATSLRPRVCLSV